MKVSKNHVFFSLNYDLIKIQRRFFSVTSTFAIVQKRTWLPPILFAKIKSCAISRKFHGEWKIYHPEYFKVRWKSQQIKNIINIITNCVIRMTRKRKFSIEYYFKNYWIWKNFNFKDLRILSNIKVGIPWLYSSEYLKCLLVSFLQTLFGKYGRLNHDS